MFCDKQVYDGTSTVLTRKLYGYVSPAPVVTSTNKMTVTFFGDGINDLNLEPIDIRPTPFRWQASITVV